jgi:hypothetical protein
MAEKYKRLSINKEEAKIQEYYHSLGYQSIRRGWPDFCFWKKGESGKNEYIFVEVKPPLEIPPGTPFRRKRSKRPPITTYQRRMKNIFTDLKLDHRVSFGFLPDGAPNFRTDRKGINKKFKEKSQIKQKSV